ncbi:MAG: hypothetical protein GY725_22825, partial [bacterium]|nr:hypothetical protein [bacterium]
MKFTEQGEIVLRVKAARCDDHSDSLRLEFGVRDTGPGISPAEIGRLFQSFTQLDVSRARQAGGTGLGLAISKQLCELMGGEIAVESEIARGTEFSFWVLLLEDGGSSKATRSPQLLDGQRALVAHENQRACFAIARQLQRLGAEVTTCNSVAAVMD